MDYTAATIGSELRVIDFTDERRVGLVGNVVRASMNHVELHLQNDGPVISLRWDQVQQSTLPWRPEVKAAVKDQRLLNAFQEGQGVDASEMHRTITLQRRTLHQVVEYLLSPQGVEKPTQDMLLSCFAVWLRHQGDLAVQNDPKYGTITKALADELANKIFEE